jgi:NLR family CARD domain-containing protein 3
LRQFSKDFDRGSRYVTTIHTLVSAILKLSRNAKIPVNRKVYRGLSGMKLNDKWFKADIRGVRGGVEKAFLSTSENRETALQYMGKRNGILLEIEVGAVDCGAQFQALSQYPG